MEIKRIQGRPPALALTPEERNKGASLISPLTSFVLIDIETTGLSIKDDEIIEIGAVKIEDFKIVDTFQCFIYPRIYQSEKYDPIYYIPRRIERLTNISVSDLVENGISLEIALLDFVEFIGNSVLMAHNANFDINFIYDRLNFYHNLHLSNDYIDTLRLSQRLFKDAPLFTLSHLIDYLKIPYKQTHRSVDDCLACLELYKKCYQEIEAIGFDNWEKEIKYSAHPSKQVIPPSSSENFDKNSIIFDKVCVMTGALSNGMHKKEVMQAIVNLGGHVADSVTKKTEVLIVGQNTYNDYLKGVKTGKLKKASELIEKGQEILIISENDFFEFM